MEEYKLKEEEINAKKEAYREEKTNLLKSKIATQRAKLSASGVDATSGSSSALISNLEKSVNDEIAQNDYFADLDLEKENANYNYKKKVNLLNASKNFYDSAFAVTRTGVSLFNKREKDDE